MAAIRATGLRKEYGDTTAVAELSLEVPSGEVYGFLGPNGAGKTTTMRMLTTLTTPTAGEAWVAGEPVTDRTTARHLGYLPTEPAVHDELTGREQLSFVAAMRELDRETAAARIDELLAEFSLTDAADDRISSYSTGMRQKLGVIAALVHEPSVVFLDEPTAGLDPRAARQMRETVASLAEQDVTVFLSSHILPTVEQVADRVGVLDDGRLVAEAPTGELLTRAEQDDQTLEDVFLRLTTDE